MPALAKELSQRMVGDGGYRTRREKGGGTHNKFLETPTTTYFQRGHYLQVLES